MAASSSSIDHDLKGTQNQFAKIYELVQKALDENRRVLLILDIDGVQDDARLEVEKIIKAYLERSQTFTKYISETIVQSVLSLCAELTAECFLTPDNPFKWLIDYIRLTEMDKNDREKVFSTLEQSKKAKDHEYYLSYCELLKTLRKIEPLASDTAVIAEITKNITSNTALICAMHLSTAICATSPLVVADKSLGAAAGLATLYRDFQRGDKNDSDIIQLTSRTEAMASTYATLLANTLNAQGIELLPLQKQSLVYTYNAERFGTYPTGAIPRSNIIAASRNNKDLITHEFLAQNGLLSQPIHIIFVDDIENYHQQMKKLLNIAQNCTVETVLFDRNRTPEEKQILCASIAESLAQQSLATAITTYQKTSTDIGDSAASAVMSHYVPGLLSKGIICQNKFVQALNSNKPPQQSTSSFRTWSDANPSTHFSPTKIRKIDGSQQPTATKTP